MSNVINLEEWKQKKIKESIGDVQDKMLIDLSSFACDLTYQQIKDFKENILRALINQRVTNGRKN